MVVQKGNLASGIYSGATVACFLVASGMPVEEVLDRSAAIIADNTADIFYTNVVEGIASKELFDVELCDGLRLTNLEKYRINPWDKYMGFDELQNTYLERLSQFAGSPPSMLVATLRHTPVLLPKYPETFPSHIPELELLNLGFNALILAGTNWVGRGLNLAVAAQPEFPLLGGGGGSMPFFHPRKGSTLTRT